MKQHLSILFISLTIAIMMSACVHNQTTKTYSITRPVYRLKQEVYDQIKTSAPTSIATGCKIYIKGNYIFLTEHNKGIHLINNSNPSSPINESFIPIPGIEDAVVKGNTLMADCFIDLLSIDISNPLDCKLVHTSQNVFPERNYVNGYSLDSNHVIVDWITKDTTTNIDYYTNYFYTASSAGPQSQVFGSSSLSSGVGGSMARFTLVDQYLYTVSTSSLRTFDVTDPSSPIFIKLSNPGWNIETIYPVKDKLFLGTQNGMFIFDISTPTNPIQLCSFPHAHVCDPVIADGQYAYITLRSGTICQGFTNQLDVVNISNMTSPVLEKSYPFTNPHGLSKDGHLLFICDGVAGFKVMDANTIQQITTLKTIAMPETYDVITFNKVAYVSAKDGLYLYDYSDENNIHLLSKVSTN